ncbi:receptor-interacting serine/threonine-protein kinase 3 isoform X2 [Sceloporus undulatus]|nr:receptor-interacting serine/threonine-protein kinase 3 isoform X2 [Sceloporus undulatus]
MDEARFLYVLRLFGLFVDKLQPDGPSLGLVMEYMENGSLSTLMGQVSSIPWPLRFRILYEVALGMNFLHSLSPPLLHLDLKLSNILLDADLHAKVADFGLSKFKRGTTQRASQASGEKDGYGGTLEYLPPEAFADLNYRPTPGTDVYSYGILMWSLLSGQEPYSNLPPSNMSSLISRLIPQGQRPSTEDLEKTDNVPKLDDGIRLMKRCWHNEKLQRPSFRDCSHEMESVFSYHREQINTAVRKVQDILVQRKSSPLKENSSPSYTTFKRASAAPPRLEKVENQQMVTASSELEDRFKTWRFEDSPSKQNEAVPPEFFPKTNVQEKSSPPITLQRSQSAYIENGTEKACNEEFQQSEVKIRNRLKPTDGKPRRPYSDTYVFPPFPHYPPGYLPYPQYFYGPHHQRDFGLTAPDHSLLPQFGHRASRGGIHIHGHDISGVQFGDNNYMHVVQTVEKKPGKKQ